MSSTTENFKATANSAAQSGLYANERTKQETSAFTEGAQNTGAALTDKGKGAANDAAVSTKVRIQKSPLSDPYVLLSTLQQTADDFTSSTHDATTNAQAHTGGLVDTARGYAAQAINTAQPYVDAGVAKAQPYVDPLVAKAQPYVDAGVAKAQPYVDAGVARAQTLTGTAKVCSSSISLSRRMKADFIFDDVLATNERRL